jgi:predicted acylesterase/phospholipase RssA
MPGRQLMIQYLPQFSWIHFSLKSREATLRESEMVKRARRFLGGERLIFDAAFEMLRPLQQEDQLSLARRVLERMRKKPECISGDVPNRAIRGIPIADYLCQQEALLTSKDPELSAAIRHDEALEILARGFRFIKDKTKPGDAETLGIAGGICKRKWNDLGQIKDLMRASEFYRRGAENDLKQDPYPHINAAFLDDLLAAAGDQPMERRERAAAVRQKIVDELPKKGDWWTVATHAEALFGLGRYDDATQALQQVDKSEKRAPWMVRTMAEQLAQLAHLHTKLHIREGETEPDPLDNLAIARFFEALLPGARDAIRSVITGKVGLALSGGGFRASFYHLGVLACLAERNALRDIDVLSCVSGGSVVGACYWLKLRQRLLQSPPPTRTDYIQLVRELIRHFEDAVRTDPRRSTQPSKGRAIWNFAWGAKGVLDPEKLAKALEEDFYRPLWGPRPSPASPILMHELAFKPADHDAALMGSEDFNPGKHNWLRADKVPALILNATTVNTGHAWHFTPTWMGESPWAVHTAADSVRRLEWYEYSPADGWQMELSRAVVASACVPLVFEPLRLGAHYENIDISLVDGGVHDNQGTVALLASDCNVVLVSDACGQLMLEPKPPAGITAGVSSGKRSMNTLMERVRLANFADLEARHRSGLLRSLMFLHMKSGLDANVIHLPFSRESYELEMTKLSPAGVLRDLQQALAELRTDLDAFTEIESSALMACGYKMATKALDSDLPELANRWRPAPHDNWPFKAMLDEITAIDIGAKRLNELLDALRSGQSVVYGAAP